MDVRTKMEMKRIILLLCLLYNILQHSHATNVRCSWGSWLPWDCTCCGGSHDIVVYRARAKCCDNTYMCAPLRVSAEIIENEDNFIDKGSCINDCGERYSSYNPNTCVSTKINLNDLKFPNRYKSCQSGQCLGTLTPPLSWTTMTTTNRPPSVYRYTHTRGENPLQTDTPKQSTRISSTTRTATTRITSTTRTANRTARNNSTQTKGHSTQDGGEANRLTPYSTLLLVVLVIQFLI